MAILDLLKTATRGPRRAYSHLMLSSLKGATGFAGSVMGEILSARQRIEPEPALDVLRFPNGQSTHFDPLEAHRVLNFLKDNAGPVNAAAELLADCESRDLLRQLFVFRALGPGHVRLPKANSNYLRLLNSSQDFKIGAADEFPPFSMARYRIEGIELECWPVNVVATFLEKQYFFQRGNVKIQPQAGDVVIDGGACFGDTALMFAQTVGPNGKVFAFEPMPRQQAVLTRNLAANPDLKQRIAIVPFAVAQRSGERLMFSDGGAGAAVSVSGSVEVESLTIDDFVSNHNIDRLDYLKLDVEGSETDAISGAAESLRKFKPRLGISIYHSLIDMVSIVRKLHEIAPQYRFYIDHHTVHSEETVLYAEAG